MHTTGNRKRCIRPDATSHMRVFIKFYYSRIIPKVTEGFLVIYQNELLRYHLIASLADKVQLRHYKMIPHTFHREFIKR